MRVALIIRFLLFCLFFTIGAGAITLSILIHPEVDNYYSNQQVLEKIRQENDRIEDLTGQYQAQIDLIRSEPNVLSRLEEITFGKTFRTEEQEEVLPTENDDLRRAAQSVLNDLDRRPKEAQLPEWFNRCMQPRFRKALFAAGAGLVLVTFIFFGTPKPNQRSKAKSTIQSIHPSS